MKPMHGCWWIALIDLVIAVFGYQVVMDLFPIFAFDIKYVKIKKLISSDKDKYRFQSVSEANSISEFITFEGREDALLSAYT